jgi:uncharacterized membrane protein YfcA
MIMQIILVTYMASIMFTSVSSLLTHHKRGHVCCMAVLRTVLGILIGTFQGSLLAADLSTSYFKVFL